MKGIKILGIFLVFALFSGIGLAQEIEEEDIEQTEIFQNPLGAEVRMLQLEKAIERSIASGEMVIEKILEYNESANIGELETTLDEIKELLEEVQNYDFNKGLNETELAAEFVELKAQARYLVKVFREAARDMVKPEFQDEIRKRAQERIREMIQEHKEQLQEIKNRYNLRVMERVMNRIGVNNTEVMAKIRNGTMSPQEFKGILKGIMSKANQEKRQEIMARMREENSKVSIVAEQVKERIRQRMNDIQERLQQKRAEIQQRLSNLPAKGGHLNDNETHGMGKRGRKK